MSLQVFTGSGVKEIDRLAINQFGYSGIELMTLAGRKAFQQLSDRFDGPGAVLVLCGSGNNGGDGYILAAEALEAGWEVTLIATKDPSTEDSQTACQNFVDKGGIVKQPSCEEIRERYDVIVDALLGVGISGAPRGDSADLIRKTNRMQGFKFAIDVPSGVDADTGAVYDPCFKADRTLTFIAPKIGLLTGPALNAAGDVLLENLQVESKVFDQVEACATILEQPDVNPRQADSHKGVYGHVVVAGGENGMLGAVLLAGRAALRAGAGKVHILSTDEHLDKPALSTPELMSAVFETSNLALAEQATAVALGPGLGLNPWGQTVFDHLIGVDKPMVMDADALTLISRADRQVSNASLVLTPHPGEAASLLGATSAEVQADRANAVRTIARDHNAVCVLKGAGTLIACPQGRLSVCTAGNPGMASAGMGDVLTGIIAALLAQGMEAYDAACAGVWWHAVSADLIAAQNNQSSLIASDVIEGLKSIHRG